MDDRVGAAECLDGLAEIGEVHSQQRRQALGGGDDVGVDHVVPVLDEVAHDGPAGLARTAGDHDLGHDCIALVNGLAFRSR